MAKPEVKITITETGSEKAAAGIGKVDQAADKASKGGLKGLTDKIPGVNSALDRIPGGADLAAGGISALGAASVAGGAALVGFAAKGVQAFAETTVEVGKFRDATGLTTDEASRLYEALGDLGVRPDEVASAVGRLEKSLGTNKDAFKQFGLEVATTKDGMIDANGTFLNAIDALNRIEDPAKRAEAGAKIFGKGWQGMAEVIASGAPALRTALESVQPSKIFTDKDIQSGRDLRAGFDSIKDAGEGLLLTVGKSLAPSIAKIAPAIGEVIAKAEPLAEALGEAFGQAVEDITPLIGLVGDLAGALANMGSADIAPGLNVSLGELNDKLKQVIPFAKNLEDIKKASEELGKVDIQGQYVLGLTRGYEETQRLATETERLTAQATAYEKPGLAAAAATQTLANAAIHADDELADLNATTETAEDLQKDMEAATRSVERALQDQSAAYDNLRANISNDQAWLDLQDTLDGVKVKGEEAGKAAAEGATDTEAKYRDAASAVLDAKQKIIDYGESVLGLPAEQTTQIIANMDNASIDEIERQLANLTRNRQVIVAIEARGGVNNGSGGRVGARASGGPVSAGKSYLVGEEGPEVVTMGSSGHVTPNDMLGGATYHVTNNIKIETGLDPRAVGTALGMFLRNGGRVPGLS